MRNKYKRLLCLVLALLMLAALAACKSNEEPPVVSDSPSAQPSAPASSAPPASPPPASPSPSPSASPSQPPPPAADPQTLVFGYSYFSQKFSPFFSKTAYDRDVADMTMVYLLINDRAGNVIMNGSNGETFDYNGVSYTYRSIADFDVVQKADGTVDYNIKLRDDILFSDGVKMTIDDVIFCIYVMCDPSYDGSYTFYSMPVTGMQNYRTGVTADIYDKYEALGNAILAAGPDNTNYSGWTAAQQDLFWTTYLDIAGAKFAQEIIDYCVSNYAAYMGAVGGSEVALGMYVWGFGEPDDDGVFVTYFTESEFDIPNGEEPTAEDYWAEILEAYGLDFSDEGINVESANSLIEDLMITAFISGEGPKDPSAGGEITNIAGIKKTGDFTCTITTDYFDATSIYQFGFQVAPMHYYGDKNLYDYNKDMFGFPKGNLDIVRTKTTTPMGAGPYRFISYESGVVSYEANSSYFKGEPKIKFLRLQEVTDADKLAGIVSGSFDITEPSFSKTTVAAIKEYNSNGEVSGDKVVTSTVDNLGYGYIGIAANNVNVGGSLDSPASRALRSALATVLASYRNTVCNSYYGERASVIQYPISNTSWAAPRPNDEGFREAYSIGVDGKSIYTSAMSEQQRYDAALQAAIGFLRAAGYTWDAASGKFTAAPAGAKLIYEAIIPADGVGNHPAYGVLTAAKEALATIGITLDINDPTDSNVLWRAIETGQAELWCAAWAATIDPDMYQVYHSSNVVGKGGTDSNHYAIQDADLDELIMEARTSADQSFRKATYRRCLEIIMEWAVEIPNYQRQNAIIFSPERVNMDTVTPLTTFWLWYYDIELIEMN